MINPIIEAVRKMNPQGLGLPVATQPALPPGPTSAIESELMRARNAQMQGIQALPNAPQQRRTRPAFRTEDILKLGVPLIVNLLTNKGKGSAEFLAGYLNAKEQKAQDDTRMENENAQSQYANEIAKYNAQNQASQLNVRNLESDLSRAVDADQLKAQIKYREDQDKRESDQWQKMYDLKVQERNDMIEAAKAKANAEGEKEKAQKIEALKKSLDDAVDKGYVELAESIARQFNMPDSWVQIHVEQAKRKRDMQEREITAKETDAAFNQQVKQAQLGFERQRIGLEQDRVNIAKDESARKAAGQYTPEQIKSQKDTLTKAESKYYAAQTVPAKTPEAAQLAKDTARANWAAEWVKMKQMQGLKIDTKVAEFITPEVVKNPDGFLKQAERAARAGVMPPEKLAEIRVLLGPILKNKNPDMSGSIGKGPLKPFAPKLPDGWEVE